MELDPEAASVEVDDDAVDQEVEELALLAGLGPHLGAPITCLGSDRAVEQPDAPDEVRAGREPRPSQVIWVLDGNDYLSTMYYQVSAAVTIAHPIALDGLPFLTADGIEIGHQTGDGPFRLYAKTRIDLSLNPLPTITRGPDGVPHFNFPSGPARRELRSYFQYLEAIGSLLLGIEEINWDDCKEEWLPETDDERGLIRVANWQRTAQDFPPPGPLTSGVTLQTILENKSGWAALTPAFAFLRLGNEAYRYRRWFEAFFHFYLYLEGMYANGKTKNVQIVREFKRNKHVMAAATTTIANLCADGPGSHREAFNVLLREFQQPMTPDGLISLLVSLRGAAFHFSPRTRKTIVGPLRLHDYHTPSFLAMNLAILTGVLELLFQGIRDEEQLVLEAKRARVGDALDQEVPRVLERWQTLGKGAG